MSPFEVVEASHMSALRSEDLVVELKDAMKMVGEIMLTTMKPGGLWRRKVVRRWVGRDELEEI
jgi:hypothetical protein